MANIITINVDDRRVRDMLNRVRSNLPKVTDKCAKKIADMYAEEIKFRMYGHNFMGTSMADLDLGGMKTENGYSVRAPKYLWYVDKGTAPHFVSLSKHPEIYDWARMHGMNPYYVRYKIQKEGTEEHRVIRDGIKAADKRRPQLIKEQYDKFIESKGGAV
jgi:hypothetical protein